MITVLCVGKLKDKSIVSLCEEYTKRISFFDKIKIHELKDSNQLGETKAILEYVLEHPENKYILLDELGEEFDSLEFSSKINFFNQNSQNIVFILSGAEGIEKKQKHNFNQKLSLSKMTFPHEIARVLLLEQIYRAYMILNNRNYHKE
jgi:23S rRNA (pseudouridine1915-N3)-methyltransferase